MKLPNNKRWTLPLVAVILLQALGAPLAQADSMVLGPASLPSATNLATAVWTGSVALVFGGIDSQPKPTVFQYDPGSDQVTTKLSNLSPAVYGGGSAWDGQNAYVFGGCTSTVTCATPTNKILRYNLAANTVQQVNAVLPSARYGLSAVWADGYAYVFGGYAGGNLNEVVRYDPVSDTATVLPGRLPIATHWTAAVWNGQHAYIFGGWKNGQASSNQIMRFDPATGTSTLMSTVMPQGLHAPAAAWLDGAAYVFGGCTTSDCPPRSNKVVRYDPVLGTAQTQSALLPSGRSGIAAVSDGVQVHLFGGAGAGTDILHYRLPPHAPQDLAVEVGPEPTSLTLSWNPPLNLGGLPLTKYRVYGGDVLGSETWLADTSPNQLTYQDADLGYARSRYYRVSAETSAGEGAKSNQAAGTTLSPGHMLLTNHPDCSNVPSSSPAYCNSRQFGYTDDIGIGQQPLAFEVAWGDFNGHEHLDCAGPCSFWMELDLGVTSPVEPNPFYDGDTVEVAQLQRWTGSTWLDLPNGLIEGQLNAPGGLAPWSLLLPGRLLLTSEELGTSNGACDASQPSEATCLFRLVALSPPALGGPTWTLDLDAAMGQLIAPPVVLVHGWLLAPDREAYEVTAQWGNDMKDRLLDRSSYVYGQDPWAWSQDGAITNPPFDAKADFRLAAFDVYDEILRVREDPVNQGEGDELLYGGPVNIIAHSMGGLVSRYLIEDVIPTLKTLNHGTLESNNGLDAINAKLNGWDDKWSGTPLYDPEQVVGNLVTMATPHLGSGEAKWNIMRLDAGISLNCVEGFFTMRPEGCAPYYLEQDDDLLLDYKVSGAEAGSWWLDEVGAYRNPDLGQPRVSVMADFELMRPKQDGNPVLDDLDPTFASREIPYFLMAGFQGAVGDFVVSPKSATHSNDARACNQVYTSRQASYNGLVPFQSSHSSLPKNPRIQDDALVFLGGEKEQVCANQPEYPNNNGGGNAMMAMAGEMAMAGDLQMESQSMATEPYEAPIAVNLTIASGVYSTRLDWAAPGASNGNLTLVAYNGTLPGATLTLRSPSGAIASLTGGNTSWASWTGPQAADGDHGLSIAMPAADEGSWTLWMNRTAPWPGFIYATVTFDTPLAITLESDSQVLIGEPATYRIRPSNAGNAVLDADVDVQFVDPETDTLQTLSLNDAGTGGDEEAGDGVYSAQHTFLALGSYPYLATATFDGATLSVEGAIVMRDANETLRLFPPTVPDDLSATMGSGAGEIVLAWQAAEEYPGAPVTGYRVYRGNATGNESLLVIIGNATAYTDSGLGVNEIWHYRVAAVNVAGWSDLSNAANATTMNVPSAPASLVAIAGANAGEIDLAWQSPAANGGGAVTNYKVYRGTGDLVATLGNVTTYTDSGLGNDETWSYAVRAVNLAGEGAASNEATATTHNVPDAPTALTAATGPGLGGISLSWSPPLDDGGLPVLTYTVHRGTASTQATFLTSTTNTSYVDGTCPALQRCYYSVTANNAAGESNHSTEANATPAPIGSCVSLVCVPHPTELAGLLIASLVDVLDTVFTARLVRTGGLP